MDVDRDDICLLTGVQRKGLLKATVIGLTRWSLLDLNQVERRHLIRRDSPLYPGLGVKVILVVLRLYYF
jgi:hypothetical protein